MGDMLLVTKVTYNYKTKLMDTETAPFMAKAKSTENLYLRVSNETLTDAVYLNPSRCHIRIYKWGDGDQWTGVDTTCETLCHTVYDILNASERLNKIQIDYFSESNTPDMTAIYTFFQVSESKEPLGVHFLAPANCVLYD